MAPTTALAMTRRRTLDGVQGGEWQVADLGTPRYLAAREVPMRKTSDPRGPCRWRVASQAVYTEKLLAESASSAILFW